MGRPEKFGNHPSRLSAIGYASSNLYWLSCCRQDIEKSCFHFLIFRIPRSPPGDSMVLGSIGKIWQWKTIAATTVCYRYKQHSIWRFQCATWTKWAEKILHRKVGQNTLPTKVSILSFSWTLWRFQPKFGIMHSWSRSMLVMRFITGLPLELTELLYLF